MICIAEALELLESGTSVECRHSIQSTEWKLVHNLMPFRNPGLNLGWEFRVDPSDLVAMPKANGNFVEYEKLP